MKRFTSFLSALLLFSAFALVPDRAAGALPMYGDVNFNEVVDIDDVIALADHLSTGTTTIADDVNGDLEANIRDITLLIDYLLYGELEFDLYSPPVPDSALVVTVNGVSFAMMPVKGGDYYPYKNWPNHDPEFHVTLSDYYMGMTEVTIELWLAVMGSRPLHAGLNTPKPNEAVDCLSFWDCKDFIARLNELTGLEFHMPTKAQWVYAAMGGQWSGGYTYAGSNDIDEVAWYEGNRPDIYKRLLDKWPGSSYELPVGMKKPNELGIYDMSGNVAELLEFGHVTQGENYDELERDSLYPVYKYGGSNFRNASYCTVIDPIEAMVLHSFTVAIDNGLRLVLQASSLPAGYSSK
jgi:hypothetical protein